MELTTDQLEALSLGFYTHFTTGAGMATALWDGLYYEVNSMHQAEDHLFSGGVPAMKELAGNLEEKGLELFSQRIRNKTFYSLVGIPVEAMEDGAFASYEELFRMMGARAAAHPAKLMSQLLLNSFSQNSYLGVPFISASQRQEDGDTWSNIVSGALSANTFATAEQRLDEAEDYQGEEWEGESLGGDRVLIVPPALRAMAESIVDAQYGTNGATNVNYGKAKVLVLSGLKSQPTWWWLARRNAAARPFILQRRTDTEWHAESASAAEALMHDNKFRYIVRRRHNVGFGHPQQIVGGRP